MTEKYKKYLEGKCSHSYDDAKERFEKFRRTDPFPQITPALLNSSDIFEYVVSTGMIYPFQIDSLHGATYSVKLKGVCILWDEKGNKHEFCMGQDEKDFDSYHANLSLKEKDELVIQHNSISYLTLEPIFQIPDYMALRFNLRVPHVYKGLLLGTGPIVDPGFVGRLSIPIHNLTSNDYVFKTLDDIISVEFTKLSPNNLWDKTMNNSRIHYIPNKITPNRSLSYYIGDALKGNKKSTIRCSIPEVVQIATDQAEKAEKSVSSLNKRVKWGGLIGIVGIVVSIVALIFTLIIPTLQLTQESVNYVKGDSSTISSLDSRIGQLEDQVNKLTEKNKQYESSISSSTVSSSGSTSVSQ